MKIFIIGQRYNNYYVNEVKGGTERVESDHAELLSKNHDVYFFTNAHSENVPFENVTTLKGTLLNI